MQHTDDSPISDKEANCFARNLLCPIPLAKGLYLSNEQEYANKFGVSIPMAKASIENRTSDEYYVQKELYLQVEELFHLYLFEPMELEINKKCKISPSRKSLFSTEKRNNPHTLVNQEEWEKAFSKAEEEWLYGDI